MRTIQLNIPDNAGMKDFDVLIFLAAKLYEDGKLSSGQAAEMAKVSKRTFIELMGKYNVCIISNSIDDLHSDIANA